MVARLINARQHWKWGSRKLFVKLAAEYPHTDWPAASTITEGLNRDGLTQRRRLRRHTPPGERPFGDVATASQTWYADFKGWFRTQDGTRCDPLTVTYAHSRYLLCCQNVPKSDTVHVNAQFETAFRTFGVPEAIGTDNGPPFASTAPGGLSPLALTLIRLGIRVEHTTPDSPQEKAYASYCTSTFVEKVVLAVVGLPEPTLGAITNGDSRGWTPTQPPPGVPRQGST